MEPAINIKQLIAHFGGRIELWRKLNARGVKISVKTIEKWGERKTIPSNRLAQLMDLALTLGRPLNINKFLLRTAPNALTAVSPQTDNEQKQQDV